MKMSKHKKEVRRDNRKIKKLEQQILDVSKQIDEVRELDIKWLASDALNKLKRCIEANQTAIRMEIVRKDGEEELLE